jgi:hypothetical protein
MKPSTKQQATAAVMKDARAVALSTDLPETPALIALRAALDALDATTATLVRPLWLGCEDTRQHAIREESQLPSEQ